MFKRRLGYSFVCCGTIGKIPLHKTRFKKNIFGGYEGNEFFIASLLCCKMLRLTWRAHYRATTRISLSPPPPLKFSVYCTVPEISQPTLQHHYSWSYGKFEVSKTQYTSVLNKHWAWHCLSNSLSACPWSLYWALHDCRDYLLLDVSLYHNCSFISTPDQNLNSPLV